MESTKPFRTLMHRRSWLRLMTAVAVGGLSATLLVDSAGATSKGVVVSTAKSSKYGTILVSGKSLYTLKPSATACNAACVSIWPELVLPKGVTKAKAGSGVSASKLGTVKRSGGVLQVTYSGKALYFFSGDGASGQVNGNVSDTWGKWSVVVTKKKSSSSGSNTGTTSSGSGGAGF
jgi:predicted lipoprotein with Yx(FWY)xxD motif